MWPYSRPWLRASTRKCALWLHTAAPWDSLRVAVLAALNLADELVQAGIAETQPGHARAENLRGLLDEVLEEDLKTGS